MARIRTIKPEFATDEKLAKVSRDARLTFVLCITQSDDDGLLPGNPRQLLAALYPLDEGMTDKILAIFIKELVDAGRLKWRQTRDGSPILQIINWANHQKVDHKGKSLILPQLREESENDATLSRKPRETLARPSRSDLGPTTYDLRPPPVADAPGRKKRAVRTADPPFLLAPYLDAHAVRFPGGMPRAGHLGKVLKALEAKHGAAETLARWRIFLAAKGQFGVDKFAETWSEWGTPAAHGAEPPRTLRATEMLLEGSR